MKLKKKIPFHVFLRIIAMVLLIIALFAHSVILYSSTREIVTSMMSNTNQTFLNSTAEKLESSLNDIVKTCLYIQNNDSLIENITTAETDSNSVYDRVCAQKSIRETLTRCLQGKPFISDIIILSGDSSYYPLDNRQSYQCAQELSALELSPQELKISYMQNTDPSSVLSDSILFSFSLNDLHNIVGHVIVERSFLETNISRNSQFLLLNENQQIIYNSTDFVPDADALNQITSMFNTIPEPASFEINKDIVYNQQISSMNWRLLLFIDQNTYTQKYLFLVLFCLGAFLASLLVGLSLSKILLKPVVAPIQTMSSALTDYDPLSETAKLNHPFFKKEKKWNVSLRKRIFFFFFGTVIIPILCFLFTYFVAALNIFNEQLHAANQATIENLSLTVSSSMQQKYAAAQRLAFDPQVLSALNEPDTATRLGTLNTVMRESVYWGIGNDFVDFYDASGNLVTANNVLAAESLPVAQYSSSQWNTYQNSFGETCLSFTLKLYNYSDYRNLGVLRFSMYASKIFDQLRILTNDWPNVYFVDALGQDLTGKQIAFFDSETNSFLVPDEANAEFFVCPISNTPWYLLLRTEKLSFWNMGSLLTIDHLYMIIILLCSIVLFSYLLSFTIFRSLEKLRVALNKFSLGDPDTRLNENSNINELADICASFNRMAERIDNLVDDLLISNNLKVQYEHEKNTAEIIALQMQINPHFLSNTIDTIVNIVISGDVQKARYMLNSLNNLFRYGVSRPEYIITVNEELQYARAYTNIMHVRYTNIEFAWFVDESALDTSTIKFILQPIIENAIYHGVREVLNGGKIEIHVRCDEMYLYYEVIDNGAGVSRERLQEVVNTLQQKGIGKKIGLCNVQARIHLYYGDEYNIEMKQLTPHGTSVSVKLPRRIFNKDQI